MVDAHVLEAFVASMPDRYAQAFDQAVMVQHARTVRARRGRPVNVGLFASARPKTTALCVVAPDRPGLLAIISLAFVTCELDIVAADVFTRHSGEFHDEAVDLFWVRRHSPNVDIALTPADIRTIRDTLLSLLQQSPQDLLQPQARWLKTPAATGTVIRFMEDVEGRFTTLEIETNDRTGLLLGVCQALFGEGIQIVGSRIKTSEGRVSGRFEIVDLSERPIEQSRRHVIKHAVLSAVDSLPRDTMTQVLG